MRLGKFLRLDSADRGLLVRSACLLAAMRVGLCVMSVRRLHALGGGRARRRTAHAPAGRHSAERIAWAVQAVARYVPGATCLPQALTAERLLMRYGHHARLRIGMTMSEDRALEGHAWVESDGSILLGGKDVTRYTALAVLDPQPMAEPWTGDRR